MLHIYRLHGVSRDFYPDVYQVKGHRKDNNFIIYFYKYEELPIYQNSKALFFLRTLTVFLCKMLQNGQISA